MMRSLKMMNDPVSRDLNFRAQCLSLLMKRYGNTGVSNKSIYECANELIEKGNKITHGLISYYETYFNERQEGS